MQATVGCRILPKWALAHDCFYDPTTFRFTQPDTIIPNLGNSQTLNRYSYGYNNPVKHNEPSGHNPYACFSDPVCLKWYTESTYKCGYGYGNTCEPITYNPETENGPVDEELDEEFNGTDVKLVCGVGDLGPKYDGPKCDAQMPSWTVDNIIPSGNWLQYLGGGIGKRYMAQ